MYLGHLTEGHWVYHNRAIDHDGNLVDSMLNATRRKKSAIRDFRQAQRRTTVVKPTCFTTDKLASYPKAIRKALGQKVVHRTIST